MESHRNPKDASAMTVTDCTAYTVSQSLTTRDLNDLSGLSAAAWSHLVFLA